MSILNLFPIALAALGLVLRWYLFASAKPQIAMPDAHAQVNAEVRAVKATGFKQAKPESRVHVLANVAAA